MPLEPAVHQAYADLLRKELVCALGCTEPIALAYACALAGRILGGACEHLHMLCSGNIIKNVKSVVVPNSEGMKGVEAASVLGLIGGDALARLEVLESVGHEHVERARELIAQGFCSVELLEGVPNLYIIAQARGAGHAAQVVIADRHTNVCAVSRDGAALAPDELAATGLDAGVPAIPVDGCCGHVDVDAASGATNPFEDVGTDTSARVAQAAGGANPDTAGLTMASIVEYARTVNLDDVREVLERQISCNTAIAAEGLSGHWGSEIGRTVMATRPVDVVTRMRARAAAGSDARMGGCSLPVVINSGSGNQGMTASLPVIEYAETIHAHHDELLRALCVSNLTAMHLKHYIGSLSAFCGVVCAAAGAGAAVTYLAGGTEAQIGSTVVNTLANVGGIMCDGAKGSCAAKIASAVDAAMLGHTMAMLDEDFCAGDGLVANDVETSIMSMGYVGRVGMHSTDVEILNIMIGKTCPEEMAC